MTSSGNIMNQLVYVANHNKTFKTHVQVSSSYGKIQLHSYTFPCIEMESLLLWSIVSLIKSIIMGQLALRIVMDEYIAIYGNEKSIVMVYCYGYGLLLH